MVFQSLDSRSAHQTLPQLPVESGSDREASRPPAIGLEQNANEARPAATSTPDIPTPNLSKRPNASLTCPPPSEEPMVASPPVATSQKMFPKHPINSGVDREAPRRLATRSEADVNVSRPGAAIVTPEDPRVYPPKCPDHFGTKSARPTSSPKRRKCSPSLSKYSIRISLPQTSSGGVCCIRLPFLVIVVFSFVLAMVQAILPAASFSYLRTVLTLHPEDHAKVSGFALPNIRDRQEAFHEFSTRVSHASRANSLISETRADVQRVVRRIWQGNESNWHQLSSQLVRHEYTSRAVPPHNTCGKPTPPSRPLC